MRTVISGARRHRRVRYRRSRRLASHTRLWARLACHAASARNGAGLGAVALVFL